MTSPRRRKGPRFVPVDDLPGPGLPPRAREFIALMVLGACLFVLLSLATFDKSLLDGEPIPRGSTTNVCGIVGYRFADAFTFVFGVAAWVLFLAGAVYGVMLFVGRPLQRPVLKVLGVIVFTAMLSLLFAGPHGDAAAVRLFPYGLGGNFGGNLSPKLYRAFGGSGRLLILLFGALCALLLATEWLISAMLLRLAGCAETIAGRVRLPRPAFAAGGAAAEAAVDEPAAAERGAPVVAVRGRRARPAREPVDDDVAEPAEAVAALDAEETLADADEAPEEAEVAAPTAVDEPAEPTPAVAEERSARSAPSAVSRERRQRRRRRAVVRPSQPELPFSEPYPFPPVELFREPPEADESNTEKLLEQNKDAIESRLRSFKVDAQVVAASVGPAVTQYELRLGEGIKLSKISSYEADLAAALKAVSVRVVAPIPGKDTVGVEVPNKRRQMVLMRELLEQYGEVGDKAIPLFLGKDVAGDAIVEDLAKMPHLLIAGTTGSGKSVCINGILLSILMTRTPQQVRLVLIDPKMVELQVYRNVPHLACDVVTNMKKAPGVLEWAVEEMERRYAMLSAAGTNHIRSFNALGHAEIEKRLQRPVEPKDTHLPYIVLVIDELADLMAVAQKDVEESIQRLAQKSRAVGLHVILATQRPSTDVITGVIKANLPCQIAFKVNRKIDSRVILDSNGAEKLLGHGDMLYVSPSSHQMKRAQGAFVSEEETHAVVSYLEEHGPSPSFIPDLVQTETAKKRGLADKDELYLQAVEVILGQQRGSATLIQRALAVGYTRATRLLEMMEEDGVVGPFVGSKSRDVMLTLEEWREREASINAELESFDDELDEEIDDQIDDGEAEFDEAGEDAESADDDWADEEAVEEDEDEDDKAGAEDAAAADAESERRDRR